MKRRYLSILLVLTMIFSVTGGFAMPAKGALLPHAATLTITPSQSEIDATTGSVDVIYTLKVTPPAGQHIGVFSFDLKAPAGMTLATNFVPTKNGNGIWLNRTELAYDMFDRPDAIFETFSYTPVPNGYFIGSGTTPERNMTTEADIMTIKATITDASKAGSYALTAENPNVGPDGTDTFTFAVSSTPVVVKDGSAVTSVEVSPATATVVQGGTQQLTATVTAVGGAAETVTWSSSDASGKVTVSESGLVSVTADASVGDYTITATSTVDNTKSDTATITVTLAPAVTSVTVSPETAAVIQGGTQQLTATVVAEGGAAETVTWSSSDAGGKVTVSESGFVSVAADASVGDYTITATSTVDNTKSDTATITVNLAPAVTSVTVTPETATVARGETQQLTAVVAAVGGAAETVTWSSSDASGKVTVSESGLVSVAADAAAGDYTITVTSTIDNTKSDTTTITVRSNDARIKGVTVDGVSATVDGTDPTIYNVEFPFGFDLADLASTDIVVTATDSYAVVGTAATTDGGATWTVEVTAEDGTTKETYTINVTVVEIYAFDVLVDADVEEVYDYGDAYPVCNGLLVYVEAESEDEAVEMSFTPGANDGGVYNVTLDVAYPGSGDSFMEFVFTELPTVPSEISLTSGAAFTLIEAYSDDYNSEPTGTGDTYYSLYQGFEFEGLEPGGQLNATFTATLPRSDGDPVVRTINLTVRHNPELFPDLVADFNKLLGTRSDLFDYEEDPVEIRQGVMFSDDNDWLTSEQVLSSIVNGYRAFAVKANSYVDVALAFETSEYDKVIFWDLYDSTGELFDDDDYYEIDYELMNESDELQGYRSSRTDGIDTSSEAGPWLLVATNIRGDYLPIVLSLTDVSDEGDLVLPQWQAVWDDIIAGYETTYTVTISGGGSEASGAGGYAKGDTVNINAGSRSGYTFNGWTSDDVTITNASNKTANFTMPANNVTVTATWKRTSSGGGGGGVVTPTVTGVKIKSAPGKVSYTKGDELDLTGLQVTLTYSNGTTKNIALADFADYKITVSPKDGDVLDADDKEIVITVNGKTVKQTITVEEDATVTPPVEEPVLTDISGYWAKANIEHLVEMGAISGYPDNTFKPDNPITRAEFAVVLVKAFDLKAVTGKVFDDTASHWAEDYIATAAANGIVTGYSDTEFGPDDLITREQMAVMIVKAAKLSIVTGELNFIDKANISDWASSYVITAVQNELMNGYQDNSFKPLNNATRAEAATVIYNALMK